MGGEIDGQCRHEEEVDDGAREMKADAYGGGVEEPAAAATLSHPKIPILVCDLENTKNKTKDFTIL